MNGAKGSTQHSLDFKANPIQFAFITSQATADLFSSRRGEGKSAGLCWSCFYHTQRNPGARWCFIRDTFENLQRSTMRSFFGWFKPGVHGEYHHTRKEWTWASGLAEGSAIFLGMDEEKDAAALQSLELGGIAMDEAAPAVSSGGISEMVFSLGLTSLRQPGMKWYAYKVAENNPDESHWTYRRFVSPGTPGYMLWQPRTPENLANLPENYYSGMRAELEAAGRQDLVRRFVDGEFGFQSQGRACTPQWSDQLHLATGLAPIRGRPLHLLWDFGHNPTCLVTQTTPMGEWLFLDALSGDGIGVVELIENELRPLWLERYERGKHALIHIGDPAGSQRSQVSIMDTPVGAVKRYMGGTWRPGPVLVDQRLEPLRAVLTRTTQGHGIVRVDRERAKLVHWALRGGYHFAVSRAGVISGTPVKNEHSHVGDAAGYGAAILFPLRKLGYGLSEGSAVQQVGTAFGRGRTDQKWSGSPGRPTPLPNQTREYLARQGLAGGEDLPHIPA